MRRTTTGLVPMLQAMRALVESPDVLSAMRSRMWRATE
jgi:hypothetical protein